MTTDVQIANLALSHIGDRGGVSSLSPPDSSAQAGWCATYYPLARDTLLETHPWTFATRRTGGLAALTDPPPQWAYAYALPAETLRVWAVYPAAAADDLYLSSLEANQASPMASTPSYTPVEFERETDDLGVARLLCNQAEAAARVTFRAPNALNFSSLFVTALSWRLASMLAGPIIKGQAGSAEAKRCEQQSAYWLSLAKNADGSQSRRSNAPITPWIAGR